MPRPDLSAQFQNVAASARGIRGPVEPDSQATCTRSRDGEGKT